ncbi:MAG: hypothetical protein ACPGGK_04060 [Pikeienuella sp.]
MKLILDIWHSFRAMPGWVQVWVFVILVPVNFAGFLLWDTDVGRMTAIAAIVGIGPNLFVMIWDRGFGRLMALPHLVPWTVLVIWLIVHLTGANAPSGGEALFGWSVVAINSFSLWFDYPDAVKWLKGDRAPAGRG